MRLALIPIALLAAAAPAASRDRSEIPAATPDGKAEACIPLSRIKASHVRSDSIIDFEMLGGKVYRNTLPDGCPQLGFEERFSHKTSIDRLCDTDVITVLTGPDLRAGASCGLGEFQPVKLAKAGK